MKYKKNIFSDVFKFASYFVVYVKLPKREWEVVLRLGREDQPKYIMANIKNIYRQRKDKNKKVLTVFFSNHMSATAFVNSFPNYGGAG